MRAIRIIALAMGALALSACASVLGIEEQTFDGADASAGGSAGTSGSGGSGGVAGDASVEQGGGGSGGSAGDAASEHAGGSGGGGGAAADAGDADGSGGSGGCTGATCLLPNAVGICTAGICKIDHCALHYEDCDSVDSNGCEASLWTDPENCYACGKECSATNGTPSCVAGVCQLACSAGFDDCDGVDSNGCEASLWTDVANCDGCGKECSGANGAPSCVSGACKIACSADHADCDGDVTNGCETSTNTDASNCGACGVKCATGEVCVSGKCTSSCAGGAPGQSDCGPSSSESCCTSLTVPGGTVQLDGAHSATVSDYRLDKYEITVGRFRAFVTAVVNQNWRPAAGSGKHTHLNGGSGLSDGGSGYEPGWDASWNENLLSTKGAWDVGLSCDSYQTWTSAAGGNEKRPINCITWYEAEAFCIWDGGFLPSEAEWQYAAAGGGENRTYPWGATAPTDTFAVYCGGSCSSTQNVGSKPDGNGKWGQSDLAGNVWEWALDWYDSYPLSSSTNYANTTPSSNRVSRGSSFSGIASTLLASYRNYFPSAYRSHIVGARCARSP